MAENASSASPSNLPPQPSPVGGGSCSGSDALPLPKPPNPSLSPSQIPPSPSMSAADPSQISSPMLSQPQSQSLDPLEYSSQQQPIQSQQQQQQQMQGHQQQQQQQNMMSPSSGIQMQPNLQRSGSVSRLSQIQQLPAGGMQQPAAMYGGQMNFAGTQTQQQQQLAAAARMARLGMLTQAGQLPILPGQTAQHLNLQSHLLAQPRQKSMVQGTQFHPSNSSGQALQGMQPMGMMGNLGLNPQLRANGPLSYGQRHVHGQIRPQQISQQIALTSSQKPPSQSMPRLPSVAALNPQVSGMLQNGQSALVQTALSQQQQWLKHLQPSLSGPISPSYLQQQQRPQQQPFLSQQLAPSQMHQKAMALAQLQISQLVQQQPQLSSQQQQQQQENMLQQQQQQQENFLQQQQPQQLQQFQQQKQHEQLQSPRMSGSAVQNPSSLTGSYPETSASGPKNVGGSSSQGTVAPNKLLGKRKIHDLVLQVDPLGQLDADVEDLLLEMADDFIESVTTFACRLAKHRKSSILEAKDVLLHLEKNWNLTIPGYTREEQNQPKRSLPLNIHNKRLEMIRESTEIINQKEI